MGDITIKVPQKITRSYRIENRHSAEGILKQLERLSSVADKTDSSRDEKLRELSRLVADYRHNLDSETQTAIETAKNWREKWNR